MPGIEVSRNGRRSFLLLEERMATVRSLRGLRTKLSRALPVT